MLPKTTLTSFLQLASSISKVPLSKLKPSLKETISIHGWFKNHAKYLQCISNFISKKCGIFTLALTPLLVSASSRISVFYISTQGLFSSFFPCIISLHQKKHTHQKPLQEKTPPKHQTPPAISNPHLGMLHCKVHCNATTQGGTTQNHRT